MNKIRAAVVGYGNIGQYVVEALEAAPDFEIAGIVRRSGAENKPVRVGSIRCGERYKGIERCGCGCAGYSDP